MGLFVRNLVDVLKTEGEAFVENVIKSFSCKYNHDVDRYLKEDAILFTAMSSSVTHFVFDAESGLCVAYFALAHKPISFQEDVLSNNQRKRIERFCKQDPKTKLFNVSAYLIAQLGKNYNAADGKLITGGQVLDLAKDELRGVGNLTRAAYANSVCSLGFEIANFNYKSEIRLDALRVISSHAACPCLSSFTMGS